MIDFQNLGYTLPDQPDALDEIAPPSVNTRLDGHNDAARFLVKSHLSGTLHHGLALDGERGIGKATLAFHFTHWLMAGAQATPDGLLPPPDPANPSFRQIAQDAHPNVLQIHRPQNDQGTGFKTVITVGEIRRINRFLTMSASGAYPRVVIIDAANDMNTNAANALLKVLEEPPANTYFLLIAHGTGSLLPTIKSRTQSLKLHALDDQQLTALLPGLLPGADAATINRLVGLADGSVRQALVMHLYGGADLDEALSELLSKNNFDAVLAHKVADVAATRGSPVQNRLIRDLIAKRIRDEAMLRVRAGRLDDAAHLARLDQTLNDDARTAAAFNLDVKTAMLVTLGEVHSLFHKLAA
ncbi:MAG: DNA polymerase III subunit delta' [Ahrensia sp.]